MKLIRKICILAALVGALAVTVSAQEVNLKVSNATAKKGEIVYLTLELTQPVEGNTVSVKYSYDETRLKPVADSCKWVPQGFMANFDKANPAGVWSTQNVTQLKGGLCILAFELLDSADQPEKPIEVKCEVKVNVGNTKIGSDTAIAKVFMDCAHSYGAWKDKGNLGHVQTCTLCQGQHTQSHTWDQGKETQTKDPGKVEMLYTCTVCGGTKTVTQNKEQEIFPTFSKPEEETKPSSNPAQPQGPITPTAKPSEIPELTDPQQGKPTESTGHDHGQQANPSKSTVPSHDHDHDHVTQPDNEGNPILTGAVITVVVAAMVTGAILLVKKKK